VVKSFPALLQSCLFFFGLPSLLLVHILDQFIVLVVVVLLLLSGARSCADYRLCPSRRCLAISGNLTCTAGELVRGAYIVLVQLRRFSRSASPTAFDFAAHARE